tara:strand:+ start:97 stop:549 length:453 start_codon:yes stop_codon:yes gene_type:complete
MAIKSKKYLVDKTKTKKTKPLKPIKPKTIMLVPDLESDFICEDPTRTIKAKGGKPNCFNSYYEYEAWKNQTLAPRDYNDKCVKYVRSNLFKRMKFCYDCTPEYQAKMLNKHRCENPNVSFVKVLNRRDEDYDGVFGVLLKPLKIKNRNII